MQNMLDNVPVPKYERVKAFLTDYIDTHDSEDGRIKLPTQSVLVKQFSVSVVTVRKAISDLIAEGRVEPEQGRGVFGIKELQKLERQVQTHVIGCTFSNLATVGHPYIREIMSGVESVIVENGYHLSVLTSSTEGEGENLDRAMEHAVRTRNCDGLLLLSPVTSNHLYNLSHAGFPFVLVNNKIFSGDTVDCVIPDMYEIARLMGEHIASKGYKRIFFVPGDPHTYGATTFVSALNMLAGILRFDPVIPENIHPYKWTYGVTIGDKLVREILPLEPELLIFNDCLAARGFYEAAQAQGVRVPDDIAIMTYTDMKFDDGWESPFTAADTHLREMGEEAARVLLSRIDLGEVAKGTERIIKPTFHIRTSG